MQLKSKLKKHLFFFIYASYNAVNPTKDFQITLTQRGTVLTN